MMGTAPVHSWRPEADPIFQQPGSTATATARANADFADYADSLPGRETGVTQRAGILWLNSLGKLLRPEPGYLENRASGARAGIQNGGVVLHERHERACLTWHSTGTAPLTTSRIEKGLPLGTPLSRQTVPPFHSARCGKSCRRHGGMFSMPSHAAHVKSASRDDGRNGSQVRDAGASLGRSQRNRRC